MRARAFFFLAEAYRETDLSSDIYARARFCFLAEACREQLISSNLYARARMMQSHASVVSSWKCIEQNEKLKNETHGILYTFENNQ